MATIILHRADSRGHADHGWLNSFHTFSFAQYHDPERVHFGALRVLNDDTVAAGMGFGTHPHENMEIISIPLEGDLEHKDSMGNSGVIRHGDIQVMSAGTGIRHSEFNHSRTAPVKFLQIWVFPNQRNVPPRYQQVTLDPARRHNALHQVLSPHPEDGSVWIHQNAWFHLGAFDPGVRIAHKPKDPSNGMYVFVIKGGVSVNGTDLGMRDGMGLQDAQELTFVAGSEGADVLLMEVPMTIAP